MGAAHWGGPTSCAEYPAGDRWVTAPPLVGGRRGRPGGLRLHHQPSRVCTSRIPGSGGVPE
eukprot:11292055-Alexandrium_andersonii.AAC.1